MGIVRIAGVLLVGAAMAALSVPAVAKDKRFHPYEGLDAIKEGRGGTKIDSHGIAIWTSGEQPIGRYRILGMIIDKRTGLLSGSALRSEAFAKRVQAAGGDAAIVLSEERRTVGGVASGNSFMYTPQKVSQFMVVKAEPSN